MNPARFFSATSPWRRAAQLAGCLGLGLAAGCASFTPQLGMDRDPTVRAAQPEVLPAPPKLISPGPDTLPEKIAAPVAAPSNSHLMPMTLDYIMRTAQDQNGQIAIAREKLNESFANQELAAKRWLPDLYAGTAWYRHEGGIQDFKGNLIHSSYGSLFAGIELRGKLDLREAAYQKIDAERRVWQQKGEVSKLTSENLLDAANTYIDLLATRTGEAIGLEMEKKLNDLLNKAQKLTNIDPGVKVEVTRIESELSSQKQLTRKLREGAVAANAKLVYLLSLPGHTELMPSEQQMITLNWVDANQPVQSLVEQALTRGPGVRELQGLLNLIEDARAKANGPGRYMPTVEMTMAEGAFGAGPGARTYFDNRWDLGLQVRWNLTEHLTAKERRRVADAKMQQAHLSYQELRGKLTLGVEEAREATLSNFEQVRFGEQQIRSAEESFRLSDYRLTNTIKGASPSEVLLSLRALAGARLTYLNAIRELDKAQLRLFVLVGASEDAKEIHP